MEPWRREWTRRLTALFVDGGHAAAEVIEGKIVRMARCIEAEMQCQGELCALAVLEHIADRRYFAQWGAIQPDSGTGMWLASMQFARA